MDRYYIEAMASSSHLTTSLCPYPSENDISIKIDIRAIFHNFLNNPRDCSFALGTKIIKKILWHTNYRHHFFIIRVQSYTALITLFILMIYFTSTHFLIKTYYYYSTFVGFIVTIILDQSSIVPDQLYNQRIFLC